MEQAKKIVVVTSTAPDANGHYDGQIQEWDEAARTYGVKELVKLKILHPQPPSGQPE